jgi:hypothetical protein
MKRLFNGKNLKERFGIRSGGVKKVIKWLEEAKKKISDIRHIFIAEIIDEICVCPICHGEGGEKHIVTDEGFGPFYPCGECNGKGTVNFFRRLWLLTLINKDNRNVRN